ncbi:MAG: hypothetical protein JW955_02985 [Sedimentisphaerales bacterium]|nr:hypothetical protein [Sedimentisphaerales bacterium]
MTNLATTVSQAMEGVPWPQELSFPDVSSLLPCALVCISSIFLTTIWLLAVSRYTCKRTCRR